MTSVDLKKAAQIAKQVETKSEPGMYNVEQISALLRSGLVKSGTEARIVLQALGYRSPSQIIRGESPKPIQAQTINIEKVGIGKYQITYQAPQAQTVEHGMSIAQQKEDLLTLSQKNPFKEAKPATITTQDIQTVADVAKVFAEKGIPATAHMPEEIIKGSYQGVPTHAIVTDKPVVYITQPITSVVENYKENVDVKHPNVQVVVPQAVKEYAIKYSSSSVFDKAMAHASVDLFSRFKGAVEMKSQTEVTHEYMVGAFQQAINEGGQLSLTSAAIRGFSATPTIIMSALTLKFGLSALASLGGAAATANKTIGIGIGLTTIAFSTPQLIKWGEEGKWSDIAAFGLTAATLIGVSYLGGKLAQHQITSYNYAKLGEKALAASGYDVKEFSFKEKVEAGKVFHQELSKWFLERTELYAKLQQTLKMYPELTSDFTTKTISSDVLKLGDKKFFGVQKGLVQVNERFLLPIKEYGPKIHAYKLGGKTYFVSESGYIRADLFPSFLKDVYYFSSTSAGVSISKDLTSVISEGKVAGSSKWLKGFEMKFGSAGLVKEFPVSENLKFGVYASKTLGISGSEVYTSRDFGFYKAEKILSLPEGEIKISPNLDLKVKSGTAYSIKEFGLSGWKMSQPSVSFGSQTVWQDVSKSSFYSQSGTGAQTISKTFFVNLEKSLGKVLSEKVASSVASQIDIPKPQILQTPEIQVKPAVFAPPIVKTDLKLDVNVGKSLPKEKFETKVETSGKNVLEQKIQSSATFYSQPFSFKQFQPQSFRIDQSLQQAQQQRQEQKTASSLKTVTLQLTETSSPLPTTPKFSFNFPKPSKPSRLPDMGKPSESTKIDIPSAAAAFRLPKLSLSFSRPKASIPRPSRVLPTADLPHIEKSFALFGKATFPRGKGPEKMFANIAKRFGVFARFPTLELMKKR